VYKKIFDDFIHNIEHGAGIHYMEETMAKRINVSIPDKLYSEIQKVKKWLIKEDSVSKIVQKALVAELEVAKARAFVWNYGFNDGKEYIASLSPREQLKAKKMVLNFPRQYPEDLTELLMKTGLIELENIEKLKTHLAIIEYWKCIFKRFEFMENVDQSWFEEEGRVNLWEWGGRPPIHDGEEIWTQDDEHARIRWDKIKQLWREGLIAGIKEATNELEESDDENE
jgi:hypothetical protein